MKKTNWQFLVQRCPIINYLQMTINQTPCDMHLNAVNVLKSSFLLLLICSCSMQVDGKDVRILTCESCLNSCKTPPKRTSQGIGMTCHAISSHAVLLNLPNVQQLTSLSLLFLLNFYFCLATFVHAVS